MGRSAHRRKAESRAGDWRAVRCRYATVRLAARGVLDERERRRSYGSECNEPRTTPSPHTSRASMSSPSVDHLTRRPDALECKAHRSDRIAPGGDVVGDRIVEVIAELGTQTTRPRPAHPSFDRCQVPLDLRH